MKKILLVLISLCVLSGCSSLHTHQWEEATCDQPKTCSKCGETEGEALGHTTDAGLCTRCNGLLEADLINKIERKISNFCNTMDNINDEANDLQYYVDNMDLFYLEIAGINGRFYSATSNLGDIIDLCGNYQGLSNLKSKAQAAFDAIPDGNVEYSEYSINNWVDQFNAYNDPVNNLYDTINDFENEIYQASFNI